MSKEEKKKRQPRLRFPEFLDEEWTKTKLGNISEIVRGGSPRPIEGYLTNDPTGLNWLKIGDVRSDSKFITSTKEKVIQSALSKTREVYPGDLILSNSMSFGRPYILKIKTCIHDGWIAITQIKAYVNTDYLYYFILSPSCQVYFLNYSAGSGVQNLNADIIKLLDVVIPKPHEQQKIVDCLSSLDELMAAQSSKLEALKAHKKGLMQALFPAEGETVPSFRFPEFRESGEWEEKTLGEISKITSGGTPSRAKENYWNGSIPWVSTTLINFNTINAASELITEAGLQNSSAKVFPSDTILMAMYGQGKTRGKVAVLGIEAATNQACAAIILKEGYSTNFVFQYLAAHYKEIRELSNQGGQENLSAGLIERIPITVPDTSTDEQQKIANCLSSLDALITAQTEKLETLKLHKKGLMQGLFPATGNTIETA